MRVSRFYWFRFMFCCDCCFLVPSWFNLIDCLGLSMLMRTLTFLLPGTLFFFKAKPNMLWVGSFLGSFHSTFSAWQSQSLSRSHVWYIFWPWFQSGMFLFDVLDFCCRSELEAAPHLQQLLPVPRRIGTLEGFFETCWLLGDGNGLGTHDWY